MIDTVLFSSVAKQMMAGDVVKIEGASIRVRRTSASYLRTVAFRSAEHDYQAIEQNPEKPSRWGQLAREGHQVVQFKGVATNRFLAVAVDGEVKVYGTRSAGK